MSQPSPIPHLTAPAPGSPFVSHDREFGAVLGAAPRLAKVVSTDAHEGPVYAADEDALYFTTPPRPGNVPSRGFPEVQVKRLALDGERFPLESERLSVVRPEANAASGMALDLEGRLVVSEQGTRSQHAAVTRLDRTTAAVETVVDAFRGLRLNSRNDVVVKSDGSVWFTDPCYGHLQGFKPEPLLGDYVYRYDPQTGHLAVVADSFDKPNGLAFSPTSRPCTSPISAPTRRPAATTHSGPTTSRPSRSWTAAIWRTSGSFAVTTPGFPDGIKVDSERRVFASAFSAVQIFNPGGDLIGEIALPGAVNFVFGGPDRNVLYVTADTAIWAAVLTTTGAPTPGPKGA